MNPRSHQLDLTYSELLDEERKYEHIAEYLDRPGRRKQLVSSYAHGATSGARLAMRSPQAACTRKVARQLTNDGIVHPITIRQPSRNQSNCKYSTMVD